MEEGTVRVKSLVQEHNTMSPTRAQTLCTGSTGPPRLPILGGQPVEIYLEQALFTVLWTLIMFSTAACHLNCGRLMRRCRFCYFPVTPAGLVLRYLLKNLLSCLQAVRKVLMSRERKLKLLNNNWNTCKVTKTNYDLDKSIFYRLFRYYLRTFLSHHQKWMHCNMAQV